MLVVSKIKLYVNLNRINYCYPQLLSDNNFLYIAQNFSSKLKPCNTLPLDGVYSKPFIRCIQIVLPGRIRLRRRTLLNSKPSLFSLSRGQINETKRGQISHRAVSTTRAAMRIFYLVNIFRADCSFDSFKKHLYEINHK